MKPGVRECLLHCVLRQGRISGHRGGQSQNCGSVPFDELGKRTAITVRGAGN